MKFPNGNNLPKFTEIDWKDYRSGTALDHIMWFWIPQPKEEMPVPERCTHKCVQCGMYFQHPGYMKCAEAKHKDCKAK